MQAESERTQPVRVAVTGIGPITAVGTGVDAFWNGLRRQRSPVRRVTRFDASPWRSQLAAEVDDFDAAAFMDAKVARRMDRFGHFSIAASRLALADARLDPARLDVDRVAVQIGSALGGAAHAEAQAARLYGTKPRPIDPRVALTTFP